VKLLLDENLSPQHALELKMEGHDAVAVREVGLSGASDGEVLRFAVENGRVLVTLDADFANVMRFPPERTLGVVRLKVHPPTEERIRQAIQRAVLFVQNIEITGRLAVVDDVKIGINIRRRDPTRFVHLNHFEETFQPRIPLGLFSSHDLVRPEEESEYLAPSASLESDLRPATPMERSAAKGQFGTGSHSGTSLL
jgi:predicted nuclease of predicted toxin-antitoxin system